MNHQEKKAAKKAEKKQATYQMTMGQLEEMEKKAYQKAYDKAWEDYNDRVERMKRECTDMACRNLMVVPIKILHEEYGFGKGRMEKFAMQMIEWFKVIDDDPDAIYLIVDSVEKLTGLRFELEV